MESDIERYFVLKRPAIRKQLAIIFAKARIDFAKDSFLAKDMIRRLADFSAGGKMVRGCLVMLGAELKGEASGPAAVDVAAAMEIIHASLLIHDDIMDNDWQRRRKPTVFAQYFAVVRKKRCANALETAKSLAICAADAGFFLAMKAVAESDLGFDAKKKIISRFGRDVAITALAQADDVLFGAQAVGPALARIETMYKGKTARYTISLPLILGGSVAGIDKKTVNGLEKYGEDIGPVFQMRDDYLGMMADGGKTTKPVGSDIKDNKKTIIRRFLYDAADSGQKKTLDKIFGDRDIGAKEIETVRNLVRKLGIEKKILQIQNQRIGEAKKTVKSLAIPDRARRLLADLADFVALRLN